MQNFEYQKKTKLIFGKEQLHKLPEEIKKHTNKKILITYGSGTIKKIGLFDKVVELLNNANIEYIELGGIKPNPTVDTARAGAKLIKEHDIDFILCVGGGSALDNTKHMAIASRSEEDVWDLLLNPSTTAKLTNLPKIGSIITLAATGSEMNEGGVLSNPETDEKRAMFHSECGPVFTFEDPTMSFSLPKYQRQAGVSDIISHLLEVYFSAHELDSFSDKIVEGLLRNVIEHYEQYINTNDYEAHANIFLTSTYALNGLTNLGRKAQDWTTHSLEHEVSAYTDLTHGIGLAIIHPKTLRYYFENDQKNNLPMAKFTSLGKHAFNLQGSDQEIAEQAIVAIEELFFAASNVKYLTDVDINDFDSLQSAKKIIASNGTGSYMKLETEDLVNIFEMAKGA